MGETDSFASGVSLSEGYVVTNISVGIGVLAVILTVLYFWLRKRELPSLPNVDISGFKRRFRKREKIMFYGRKMLRRVRSFAKGGISPPGNSSGNRRSASRDSRKKKLALVSIARQLLRFRRDQEPHLETLAPREPPASLLEVDWPPGLEPSPEYRLPAELMFMLRNVRVLGHFEKPIFLELCRFMESRYVTAGEHIFRIGDTDDSIYVVQSGRVEVHIMDPHDNTDYCVKVVNTGESVHSLLSILDVLTGHPAPYRTVSAVAVLDTTVLRLPARAFQIVLERFPESMVRVVQIIMVRLQRVTFMALHNYLGLGHELVCDDLEAEHEFLVHSLSGSSSPAHKTSALKEGRVAPAGAENDMVTPAQLPDDDTGGDAVKAESLEPRKRHVSRSRSTPVERGEETSDFDAVCSRARVSTGRLDDDLIPLDSIQQSTPNRRSRKVILTDNVSVIPIQSSDPATVETTENDETCLAMAVRDLVRLLDLKDESLLTGRCSLLTVHNGATIIRQGDADCDLYFVVSGHLDILQQTVGKKSEQRLMYVTHTGEMVGALSVLTGEPSFFTIRAGTNSRLICIKKTDFYTIMKEQPFIVLNVSHTVVRRMSAFVRQIDFALDWMLIDAGHALYRQGDHSEYVFIILTGRLRSVVKLESKKELIGEYGRGELVGLVEVLTQTDRATTMMAVRDTELAQIPDDLLNHIKRRYPQVVTRLIHLLGHRILGSMASQNPSRHHMTLSEHPNVDPRPTVANLAAVAVLPASDGVPLSTFTLELQHALNAIGPTLRLSTDLVQLRLGSTALDPVNDYRLSSWLGQQEDVHRMVLYECDRRFTPWTQRCIRQADCILLVALADRDPAPGSLEKQLEGIGVRAQKELILLHREDGAKPRNTVEWLRAREWCTSHHHIRCPKRVFSRKAPAVIADVYRRLLSVGQPDRMSDFSRLARFLTGSAIGLVLGGGGARGGAHVGVIRAMAEARIPIDIVGGTSIGSLVGALWADETDVSRLRRRAVEWSRDMSRLWRTIVDLTYPFTAMFTGSAFNRCIESTFGDCQIEDLWIPYFCITTDLTASKMRVHTHGSLWRYVRSSMSLSGYLPPLCDPTDGHLLLDGGYVNNVPADVMKTMGAQTIIAVDVGSQDDPNLTNYGDQLSGWWLLWRRWWPWASAVKVPNMAEIQSRLAYISCVRQLEQVLSSGYADYIRPPIDCYRTLQFGSFDEIADCGYSYARDLFAEWSGSGHIQELFTEMGDKSKSIAAAVTPVDAKFTDLAELVSRIDRFPASGTASAHVSDDDMSVISEPAIVSAALHTSPRRRKAGSEGASPGSVTASSDNDDGVDARLHDFDDDEVMAMSSPDSPVIVLNNEPLTEQDMVADKV